MAKAHAEALLGRDSTNTSTQPARRPRGKTGISRTAEESYRPEKTLQDAVREYGAWWKENQKTPGIQMGKKHETASIHPISHPGLVEQVKIYQCGSCTNNLAVIYGGKAWESRNFPATAVLIRHRKLGNILFDTGYSDKIMKGGIPLKIYRLLNPVRMKKDDLPVF